MRIVERLAAHRVDGGLSYPLPSDAWRMFRRGLRQQFSEGHAFSMRSAGVDGKVYDRITLLTPAAELWALVNLPPDGIVTEV